MDFCEAVSNRRTVREFQSKPVEADKLQRILEAGLKAPIHNHLREWEFILAKDFEWRKKVLDSRAMAKDYSEQEVETETKSMTEWEKEAYLKALPVQRRCS